MCPISRKLANNPVTSHRSWLVIMGPFFGDKRSKIAGLAKYSRQFSQYILSIFAITKPTEYLHFVCHIRMNNACNVFKGANNEDILNNITAQLGRRKPCHP